MEQVTKQAVDWAESQKSRVGRRRKGEGEGRRGRRDGVFATTQVPQQHEQCGEMRHR